MTPNAWLQASSGAFFSVRCPLGSPWLCCANTDNQAVADGYEAAPRLQQPLGLIGTQKKTLGRNHGRASYVRREALPYDDEIHPPALVYVD